ncbi:unnamed protein product [Prorocentrum cordatum]|uniref:Solute carrier family 40 protein n=1 Tax=Prorocentrum cordatum TaxID=2364126 RepID=A0ABN9TF43_9DINO|nr:unnamed protein product [Polarella glacialis]
MIESHQSIQDAQKIMADEAAESWAKEVAVDKVSVGSVEPARTIGRTARNRGLSPQIYKEIDLAKELLQDTVVMMSLCAMAKALGRGLPPRTLEAAMQVSLRALVAARGRERFPRTLRATAPVLAAELAGCTVDAPPPAGAEQVRSAPERLQLLDSSLVALCTVPRSRRSSSRHFECQVLGVGVPEWQSAEVYVPGLDLNGCPRCPRASWAAGAGCLAAGGQHWALIELLARDRRFRGPMLALWMSDFGGSIHGPVITFFFLELGASPFDVGVFGFCRAAGALLLSPLYGRWVDRRGLLWPLLACVGLCGLGCLVRGAATELRHLYAAQLLVGMGGGSSWSMVKGHVARHTGEAQRPVVIAGLRLQMVVLSFSKVLYPATPCFGPSSASARTSPATARSWPPAWPSAGLASRCLLAFPPPPNSGDPGDGTQDARQKAEQPPGLGAAGVCPRVLRGHAGRGGGAPGL